MQFTQQGILGVPSDRKFIIATLGDSNADGAATVITTCAPGTLYFWDGATTTEVTTQSVANNSPTLGSIWQPFANTYKATFGRPVLLINGSQGGSTFTPHTFSWSTSGTLYADFITKVAAGLNAANRSQVDLVIMNLGINDVRSGDTYADLTTHIASLFSRLETNFPGIPKLVITVGRYETATNDNPLVDIRNLLVEACRDNANFYIGANTNPLAVQSGYEADNVHYNQAGQLVLAQQLVNWISNSAYSKWGRSIISCMYDQITNARKTLIDNWAISQVANNNYFRLDQFLVFKTSHASNIEFDWTFLGFGVTRTATFSANNHISTNGASTRYDCTWSPSIYTRRSSVTNVIAGLKIKTATALANTIPFGCISSSGGTKVFVMGIGATTTNYRVNDGTLSAGAEASFAAGNLYSIARTGTTKLLIKNTTTNASATQANTGAVLNFAPTIGCVNNVGVFSNFYQGEYEYWYASNYASLDLASFRTETDTLIAGW